MTDLTLARTVRFTPYRKGHGPSFTLRMFYTNQVGEYGKQAIGYRLVSEGKVIFEGSDYYAHCDAGSDEAVEGIMGFLTLKPGDTDPEYFAKYTPEQTAFAEQHAEHLGYEVANRFQCPNGWAARASSRSPTRCTLRAQPTARLTALRGSCRGGSTLLTCPP